MKTINNELIRSFRPCYDPSIKGIPEDEILSVQEWVAKYRGVVPAKDILWLLLRNEFYTDKQLRLFAVWCAREALKLIDNPDQRSITACDVAERFANGEATEKELNAANAAANAARAAANAARAAANAARDAANAAAWDAAMDAAMDAANAAAMDAANAAAWDAANAAAMDAANAAANAAAMDAANAAAWDAAWDAAMAAANAAAWDAAWDEQLNYLLTIQIK